MVLQGARGILAASIILPILSVVAVFLRLLARKRKRAPLQSDDWTAIASLVFEYSYIDGIAFADSWLKIVALGIFISAIYAACTGLHGVTSPMAPSSWVRFKKVSV